MSTLTDNECLFGQYRATKCEWIFENNTHCKCTAVISGTAYCSTHLRQAYQTSSNEAVDKIVEEELDNINNLKAITIIAEE